MFFQRQVTGGPRARRMGLAMVAALILSLALVSEASGATVVGAWQAQIGTSGANGKATISAYATGTGVVALKLAKMKASTSLPVTIRKATCTGATLATLSSVKTTSAGAATATRNLSAAQVTSIQAAAGSGKVVIRIGSATTGGVKCGTFAPLAIAPYVAANVKVGKVPYGVAVAPNGVWVTNQWDRTLSRIDPATNTVLQTIPVTVSDGTVQAIASGHGSLWVTIPDSDDYSMEPLPGSLVRIDPATGTQLASLPLGRAPVDVTTSPDAVWVPIAMDDQVVRIDPATNAVAATVSVASPVGVAYGFGSLWVSTLGGVLARIDPATNQVVARIQTQASWGFVAVGPSAVWVTDVGHDDAADGTVTRVDPATNSVAASVVVGEMPLSLAAVGNSVWVGLYSAPTVIRIDATTNAIATRITVGPETDGVVGLDATDHDVWVVRRLNLPAGIFVNYVGTVTRIAY